MRIKRLNEMVAETHITESVDETMEWCGYQKIVDWKSSDENNIETKKLGNGCWAEYECGKNRVRVFIKDGEYDFVYYLPMSEYAEGVENEWHEATLDMLDGLFKTAAPIPSATNAENVEELVFQKYRMETNNPARYIDRKKSVVYFHSPISKRVVSMTFDAKTMGIKNILMYNDTTNPYQRNTSEIKNASKIGEAELAKTISEYLF